MAYNTYDDLVDAIERWGERPDLRDMIPDFIEMAEDSMFSNDVQPLMIRETETVWLASPTTQNFALPDGYESMRYVRLTGDNGYTLSFQAPDQLIRYSTTGRPRNFTVIGTEIEFDRVPDSAHEIEVQYYKRPDAITSANQTNVVLTNHSQVYLFGALAHLYAKAVDTENEIKFTQKFLNAIKGANKADKKGRYGPVPSVRIKGNTP